MGGQEAGKRRFGALYPGLVQLAKQLRAELSSSGLRSETWAAGSILAAETRHRASLTLGPPSSHWLREPEVSEIFVGKRSSR